MMSEKTLGQTLIGAVTEAIEHEGAGKIVRRKVDIVQLGDPILRQVAREVDRNKITSKEIRDLIESMKETMRAAPGVGLAAPQIGVSLQIAVIEDCEERMVGMLPEIRSERGRNPIQFHVIINPKLTVTKYEQAFFFEACLSVNGCSRITPRAREVMVECLDENGNERTINASGWYARILQHEIDHLCGKLYIDVSDKKTEILIDETNRKKWLNATSVEIAAFFKSQAGE